MKQAEVIGKTLEEMRWPQCKPTPLASNNSTAVDIANYVIKQRLSKAMGVRFYWCQDQVLQKHFCVYWNSVKVNISDYYSKHHSEKHHQMVRHIYLNKNNSPRDISKNTVVVLRGCVYSDQGNAKIINLNRLIR